MLLSALAGTLERYSPLHRSVGKGHHRHAGEPHPRLSTSERSTHDKMEKEEVMSAIFRACTVLVLALGFLPVAAQGASLAQDRDHVIRFRPISGSGAQDGRGDASVAF